MTGTAMVIGDVMGVGQRTGPTGSFGTVRPAPTSNSVARSGAGAGATSAVVSGRSGVCRDKIARSGAGAGATSAVVSGKIGRTVAREGATRQASTARSAARHGRLGRIGRAGPLPTALPPAGGKAVTTDDPMTGPLAGRDAKARTGHMTGMRARVGRHGPTRLATARPV
jgi:hypothetical protein